MTNQPASNQAIVLMGPTASGKTDLAVKLSECFPVEVISVDSALVYRGMDIGTGKPSPQELQHCPHHLLDLLDPAETYSAGQFVRDVSRLIPEIQARGRVPLLVGGTMLYFRALLQGIAVMPTADAHFRALLAERAAHSGWPALHAELAAADPVAAQRIGSNDAQRIQRALEVIALTGQPMSLVQAQAKPPLPHTEFIMIGLNPDRTALYARIELRFRLMMAQGFLDEVRGLFTRGDLDAQTPAMRAVGYRQLWQHLAGEAPLDEAIALGILATRHLARRQLIWMRANSALHWINDFGDLALERVTALLRPVFGKSPPV